MGIGTGILNMLGGSLDSQYRRECEAVARDLFAVAPIDTVKNLFGIFGQRRNYRGSRDAGHFQKGR